MTNKIYNLIQEGKTTDVRNKLKKYSTSVLHEVNAVNYLKTIDIKDFLEFDEAVFNLRLGYASYGQIFFIPETSTYYYEMYNDEGELKYRGDLIDIVSKLRGRSYFNTIQYLIDVCGITLDASDRIKRLHLEMELLSNFLLSIDLKYTYPTVYKVLCTGRTRYNKDIATLLTILKNHVIDTEDGIRLISQLSASQLSRQIYGTVDKPKITKLINLMSYLGVINKIPTDNLPRYVKSKVLNYQKEKGYKYRVNVIEFTELNDDFFHLLNKRCEVIARNNLNLKSFLTKEGLYFSVSKEEADRVFNQDVNEPIQEETQDFINSTVYYVMEAVNTQGYVLEKDIKKIPFHDQWKGNNSLQVQ